MRTSEWIQGSCAIVLALMAWIRPLPAGRRSVATLLAIFAIVAIGVARLSIHFLSPVQVSILRDWLPVVLMLVPYWQAGQFFLGPNEKMQNWLLEIDGWLFRLFPPLIGASGRYARVTMEWAYMFCYPLVPAGLAVLYAAGMRQFTSVYWFIVLVPTYFCYGITPFVPALPPRSIGRQKPAEAQNKSRRFNLWILKYGSIQAISFPSAHVASAVAISFVLLRFVPIAGAIFLVLAFWISVAAVVGRYHYTADVVLGAAVTLIVIAVWWGHLIPSSLITAPAVALTAGL
jgi:membrane-associated phospholipid phosphatase